MAISDNQKVDYLWKKLGYAAAKTDTESNKQGPNESIPSPLIIRGDKIMANSVSIPTTIPGSNSSIVTVHTTSLPVELTNDPTASTNRTWLTNLTDWISPEFGSTYQAKVYISPSGQAGNVSTKGTQVFATGSGNNDEWFFDYQAGVLNFIGVNLPSVSFTGNSVYISAARYTGQFGYPNVQLGDFTFVGNTISSTQANGNIVINAPGTGTVQFAGQDAIGLPSGDDTTRPLNPEIGYTRFNTSRQSIEYYDGSQWLAPGEAVISSDVINPDGTSNTYPLSSNTTVDGVLVSINGTLQQQLYAYDIVNNNQIQFTEIPLTTDVIEVRHISVGAVTVGSLRFGAITAVQLDTANVNVTGNVLPSANVTYDLGSPTLRWRTGYFAANTIDLGGSQIGVTASGFSFTPAGGVPTTIAANGSVTSNTLTAPTVTVVATTVSTHSSQGALVVTGGVGVGGNINVSGNISVAGNVSASKAILANLTMTGNTAIPVGKQILIGNVIMRDNGDGKLHLRDITDNADAVIVATLSAVSQTAGNIQIGTNHIESTNTNGPISLRPSGSGPVGLFANTIAIGRGGDVTIGTGLDMPDEYGVDFVAGNIILSPGTGKIVKIAANLEVLGTQTVFNTNNASFADGLVYYADGNTSDLIDLGFVAAYTTAVRYQHGGLVRDASDGVWKLFGNVVPEPTTTVNFTNAVYSDLIVGNLTSRGITVSDDFAASSNASIHKTITVNTFDLPTAIVNGGTDGQGNIGAPTQRFGNIYSVNYIGTSSSALYADLAENYVSDHKYVPGTVVDFGGNYEVTISNTDMSSAVAGVVSTNPAYLMNSSAQGHHVVAVALQGRVMTRVTGTIRKGNMLVSAGNGMARAEKNPQIGTVIGKAIEDFDGHEGTIEIVVGVR